MSKTPRNLAIAAVAVLAGLVLAAPPVVASPAPKLGSSMHWFRWTPSARTLQARTMKPGSTAVLGVESVQDLSPLRARYGFHVTRLLPQLRAAEVIVSRSLLANAAGESRIRYLSSLGSKRHLAAMPNDPLLWMTDASTNLPYEWEFAAAHVDRAFDFSTGSPAVVVGTIDTGAADVPDLVGKVDARWTVAQDGALHRDTYASDDLGHGTAVASLIAANAGDGFGMAGFGGAAHVIAVRDWALTDISIAVALMKLDSLGARIVNMSFSGGAEEPPVMLDAIHKATADGLLLVAAAGNLNMPVGHPAADLQPAAGGHSYGLAVGASDASGNLAFFSNAGDRLSLVAPGNYQGPCTGVLVAISPINEFDTTCYSSWGGASVAHYAYLSGTSFSAPEVAGVAALIWAARPELKNYQVADIIKQSAERGGGGWTSTMGCGVLDAGAALELATSRSSAEWATTDGGDAACAGPSKSEVALLREGELGRPTTQAAHSPLPRGPAQSPERK